ncbi:MAG: D-glycero-beta-D-manno-heptose 1-phosphate adenylyltransferase [Proteobacteria bacterium]|nr:D-glycero-beta-D-manno-heptose 1-phosphate adenylyltransferase [Pseudomonadota bacterium]
MKSKVLSILQLKEEVARVKSSGRTVVFTNGCFDLIHAGHVRYLAEARAQGDVLVVGVNSDASVAAIKGPSRPLVPQDQRVEVVAALESVTWAILFDDDTPEALIREILPQVLVKGADWPEDQIAGAATVKAAGGRVVRVPLEGSLSTTGIIRKILATFGPDASGLTELTDKGGD